MLDDIGCTEGAPLQNKISIKCLTCENKFTPRTSTSYDCSPECRKIRYAKISHEKQQEKYRNASIDDVIECPICHSLYSRLDQMHLKVAHGMTVDEFKKLYPTNHLQSKNLREKFSERMRGSKNIGYQHGGKLSPFSKKFVAYTDLTEDEIEEKKKTLINNGLKTRTENNNETTRISYYTSRGYSEKEAQELLTKRQRTFNLEKCIEKHGEIEGKKIWQARQDKWMATIDSKSDEEKAEINRKKLPSNSRRSISKSEMELAEILFDTFPELDIQLQIKIPNTLNWYAYDIFLDKKIIEYNGDLWHASPLQYKEDDIPPFPENKRSAKEIWEKDRKKILLAEENGYQVLVVWEHDYKKNKQETIQKCINFLKQ